MPARALHQCHRALLRECREGLQSEPPPPESWKELGGLSGSSYARIMQTESRGDPTPSPLGVAVITVSDSRTLADDKSGQALVDFVRDAGHRLERRLLVSDDQGKISQEVAGCVADPMVEVILLTGGTGVTGRDVTPEALAPLITKPIPGFGELFRLLSYEEIGASTIQSRALAGLCGATLVFALPGSTGAVRLAIDKILRSQLDIRTKPCNFAQLMPRIKDDRR